MENLLKALRLFYAIQIMMIPPKIHIIYAYAFGVVIGMQIERMRYTYKK